MKLRSIALLCMITCGYSDTLADLQSAANHYLSQVEFSNAATGEVLPRKNYNTVPYGDMDRGQVKASHVDGQPIDPATLELFTDTPLSHTYNGLSDGNYYGPCCQRVIDALTAGDAYSAMAEGAAWHAVAWIAGCRDVDGYDARYQLEDTVMSTHVMTSRGTFDATINALPADALADAQNVQLERITAWQRPLLAGGALGAARRVINSWCCMPVWNTPFHTFNITQDMKYAVRDVMEHWFLVCQFEYNGEPIYVRIERTQTGIFVTRCEQGDVCEGASWDSDACLPQRRMLTDAITFGGAEQIANTHGLSYATDSPAKGGVSLEDVLNFCKGQETKTYSMFFNNCRQFAKHAFDKFTTNELQIPSLDKGFFETNGYGPDGDHTF